MNKLLNILVNKGFRDSNRLMTCKKGQCTLIGNRLVVPAQCRKKLGLLNSMHKTLIIIFLFAFMNCFPQQNDSTFIDNSNHTDSISADSIESIFKIPRVNYYDTKWFTIGSQFDFVNSTFGFLISNGYDERPLIHFEDFSEDLMVKIQGTTDFQTDFSFGASVAYLYPIRYVSLISINYKKFDYSVIGFNHQDINIAAKTEFKPLRAGLSVELGHQKLNELNNPGINIGLQKVLIYRRLYTAITCGYYGEYWTWSARIQGFVFKDLIGLGIKYNRIDNYNFLYLGLNFTFNR